MGDWTTVFEVLEKDSEWVNSGRIGGSSGYVPLHQAAWHGADRDVVGRLLELGAWRTLRTTSGETARDLALRRQHAHLVEQVTPVVLHPASADVLTRRPDPARSLVARPGKPCFGT
jgi:ankyrin repeat protein